MSLKALAVVWISASLAMISLSTWSTSPMSFSSSNFSLSALAWSLAFLSHQIFHLVSGPLEVADTLGQLLLRRKLRGVKVFVRWGRDPCSRQKSLDMRSCPCVDDGPCSVELLLAHPSLEKGLQVQTRGWRRRASRPRWAIPYLLEGPSVPTPGGPSKAPLGLPQPCRQRVQAGLSVLCLFLCLCSGRLGLPTRCAGCARSRLPCWPAACSVVSASCGHKPYSGCLLRTQPGAARPQLCPQAQETHLRVRVMARNWCGKPLPGAAAATQAGGPDLQSSKEWWPLPSWPRRKFLLDSALWRRYEKPGIQGFRARSKETLGPPRLKSFKTKTRAGYRKQPVKHWLEPGANLSQKGNFCSNACGDPWASLACIN